MERDCYNQRLHTRAGTEQLDRERKDHQAD